MHRSTSDSSGQTRLYGPNSRKRDLLGQAALGAVSPGGDVDGDDLSYAIQSLISYKKFSTFISNTHIKSLSHWSTYATFASSS